MDIKKVRSEFLRNLIKTSRKSPVQQTNQVSSLRISAHQDTLMISSEGRRFVADLMSVLPQGQTEKVEATKSPDHPVCFPTLGALQSKIEILTSILKEDTKFLLKSNRNFMNHPTATELVKSIILSDENLQNQIAEKIWVKSDSSNGIDSGYKPQQERTSSYKGRDVVEMLLTGNQKDVNTVLYGFDKVMVERAKTTGLTDTERLLSARYEQLELAYRGTFDDKMQPIMKKIVSEFSKQGLTFDATKTYEFSLDTSSFTFSVTGGTIEENALIEKVVNTTNIFGHSYEDNTLGDILYNLQYHRQEDGFYNPWGVDALDVDSTMKENILQQNGIADISLEYSKKVTQLKEAYNLYKLDKRLKKEYGFGVDDMVYLGGNGENSIIGKTEEVTEIIKKEGYDFMKEKGLAYIDCLKKYEGTPEFSEPVFFLDQNGFHVTYAG